MSEHIIEVKDLQYQYEDGTQALAGVNLKIPKGKTTAFLGHNGAGKSTLFLNLNGILKPSGGKVFYRESLLDYSRKCLKELRKSVGIVFQDSDSQLFSASVFQDISFGPINMGLPEAEVRQRVEFAMKRTEILHLKDKAAHSLSFGQKKRVAIAGVLAMEPEIIILDEPTAGLDPHGVSEIMKLIRELQQELGLTVILSTHDIDMVPLYCDYAYLMDQGKVMLEGTPKEVFDHTEQLRKLNLRLPRIGHLMEILKKEDGFDFRDTAYTISEARKALDSIRNNDPGESKPANYTVKSGKALRFGYTTGSCASGAAKAAASMLMKKCAVKDILLTLPGGKSLFLPVEDVEFSEDEAVCCIVKDAGDDPDVTHGIKIYAKVRKTDEGISIDGGFGVGRVTAAGLACRIGEAAINPGPRRMIRQALEEVKRDCGYDGGFAAEIYVPQGPEISKRTFNERLGILGGISILGTTGIVEPMSESAIIETIKLELNVRKEKGHKVLLVAPGNYGLDFLKSNFGFDIDQAVKCSNFIGETLDHARYLGFERLLLVGHIGKLVKIAAGVMNTHSKVADCRNEIFASHSALAGADRETVRRVMQARTTQEIHDILAEQAITGDVYQSIMEKIRFNIHYRVMNTMEIGILSFSNEHGVLFQTENAEPLMQELRGLQS
jgi:cobalamin biosynthesis protein CbiD/energy-coupling factor transporter ATPase